MRHAAGEPAAYPLHHVVDVALDDCLVSTVPAPFGKYAAYVASRWSSWIPSPCTDSVPMQILKPLYSAGLCEPVIWIPAPTSRCEGSSTATASHDANVDDVDPGRGERADERVAQRCPARPVISSDSDRSRDAARARYSANAPPTASAAGTVRSSPTTPRMSYWRKIPAAIGMRSGMHEGSATGGPVMLAARSGRTRVGTPQPVPKPVDDVAGGCAAPRWANPATVFREQPERDDEDRGSTDDESR